MILESKWKAHFMQSLFYAKNRRLTLFYSWYIEGQKEIKINGHIILFKYTAMIVKAAELSTVGFQ